MREQQGTPDEAIIVGAGMVGATLALYCWARPVSRCGCWMRVRPACPTTRPAAAGLGSESAP